jgi:hypothetical protein
MNLFSKPINTKKEPPHFVLRAAIRAAVDEALEAGMWPQNIADTLEAHITKLGQIALARQDQRAAAQIDHAEHRRLAREEEIRNAKQLAADQAAYRAALVRRSEA